MFQVIVHVTLNEMGNDALTGQPVPLGQITGQFPTHGSNLAQAIESAFNKAVAFADREQEARGKDPVRPRIVSE